MALTEEQRAQIEAQISMERLRYDTQTQISERQLKFDAIRLAKEILLENARSKPADARDVTAADITAFAQALVAYLDA
jgi:hypothetical protein